jgi:hypothetical protein
MCEFIVKDCYFVLKCVSLFTVYFTVLELSLSRAQAAKEGGAMGIFKASTRGFGTYVLNISFLHCFGLVTSFYFQFVMLLFACD